MPARGLPLKSSSWSKPKPRSISLKEVDRTPLGLSPCSGRLQAGPLCCISSRGGPARFPCRLPRCHRVGTHLHALDQRSRERILLRILAYAPSNRIHPDVFRHGFWRILRPEKTIVKFLLPKDHVKLPLKLIRRLL